MAAPFVVSAGAFDGGVGAISAGVPAGYQDGDIFVLLVESANQAVTTPSGYTVFTNSPQSTGTAAAIGGVRLSAYWKLVTGTQTAVTVADTGNHTTGQLLCVRGANTASPINITAGAVVTPATATVTWPTATTTSPDCLVVLACANDRDANSTSNVSLPSNAALSGITEWMDQVINSGVGGGLYCATGTKSAAGAIGSSTATNAASNTYAVMTIAIQPAATTVLGDTTQPSDATIAPGTAAVFASAFTIQTTSGTDSVTAVRLNSVVMYGVALLEVTNSAGSTVYGSVVNPTQSNLTISCTTPIPVTTTLTTFKLRVTPKTHANMPASPGTLYVLSLKVATLTCTNPTSGSHNTAATITIDNEAPDVPSWAQVSTTADPNFYAYTRAAVAFDQSTRTLNVWGGINASAGVSTYSTWTQAGGWSSAITSPLVGTYGASSTWDSVAGRMLIFGGYTGTALVNSLSSYDYSSWSTVTSDGDASAPSGRTQPGMCFDPTYSTTGRLYLFGGASAFGSPSGFGELWQYDTAGGWVRLSTNGAGGAPPPRYEHGMCWDSTNSRVLVFGGSGTSGNLSDLWQYTTAGGWVLLTASGATGAPSVRNGVYMCWDSSYGRLLVFGGTAVTYSAEFWTWNSTDGWGPAYITASLPARTNNDYFTPCAWFDSAIGSMQIISGFNNSGATNDIQSFTPYPSITAASVTSGNGVANVLFTPQVADESKVIALYSTSPITDRPAEGSTYSVGDPVGSCTVGMVDSTLSSGVADSGTISGLSNGTAYYIKLFMQDTSGNYTLGTSPSGSPVTPSGGGSPTVANALLLLGTGK